MRRLWSVLVTGLVASAVGMASANAASSAAQPSAKRMDLAQIAKGNYSSIQGTWKSAGGVRISVSGNQMRIHDGYAGNVTLHGMHVVQTDFANSANFGGYTATAERTEGQLIFYPGTLPHLFYLVFAPQGSVIKDWSSYTVPSNTSKPRIYIDGDPGMHATRNDGASHQSSVMYLQRLPGAPSDPCVRRWSDGHSVRHPGGRLIYDRHESLRMVCEGFGTDTGGLDINWLTWGMKCALVATAIGARYGDDAEFLGGGLCTAAEVADHPTVVKAIGAACSTASTLLGLPYPLLGRLSGMACEAAPSVGHAFGTKLESHHEFAVAKDVIRKGLCLEFRQSFGASSWHAVRCPH